MNGLRYIRIRCNISISELAEEIGVSRQALSSWENGRKDIPAQRLEQLADFFGIDKSFLGQISEEEKQVLLGKAMFRYEENGRETYRYKPKEGQEHISICFPADSEYSLDERYEHAKRKKQAVLKQAKDIIRWTENAGSLESQISCINRGCEIYGMTNGLMECMRDQPIPLRMPFYQEIWNIWKAMYLAYDLMETKDLSELDAGNLKCCDDVEWIVGLSTEFKEHWEETCRDYQAWMTEGDGSSEEKEKLTPVGYDKNVQEQIVEAEAWNQECADGKYRCVKR